MKQGDFTLRQTYIYEGIEFVIVESIDKYWYSIGTKNPKFAFEKTTWDDAIATAKKAVDHYLNKP